MNSEVLKMVSDVLGVDEMVLEDNSKMLDEINAMYYWNPVRGGLAIIVDNNGEKLVATSSVSFEKHYNDFCAGKRN